MLHGNFRAEKDAGFRQQLGESARVIAEAQLDRLFVEREWRGRLAAAWFVGLAKRSNHVEKIADLLLASETPYAGQGYCVALGLIGGQRCEDRLCAYLDKYLPLNGRWYDQHWAVGALAHLRGKPPREYLDEKLWTHAGRVIDPAAEIADFDDLMHYLRLHQMIEPASST